MDQIKNEKLKERLYNWKFKSALKYLKEKGEEVVHLVTALADILGDVGWNITGSLAIIVVQALESIGIEAEE